MFGPATIGLFKEYIGLYLWIDRDARVVQESCTTQKKNLIRLLSNFSVDLILLNEAV